MPGGADAERVARRHFQQRILPMILEFADVRGLLAAGLVCLGWRRVENTKQGTWLWERQGHLDFAGVYLCPSNEMRLLVGPRLMEGFSCLVQDGKADGAGRLAWPRPIGVFMCLGLAKGRPSTTQWANGT